MVRTEHTKSVLAREGWRATAQQHVPASASAAASSATMSARTLASAAAQTTDVSTQLCLQSPGQRTNKA